MLAVSFECESNSRANQTGLLPADFSVIASMFTVQKGSFPSWFTSFSHLPPSPCILPLKTGSKGAGTSSSCPLPPSPPAAIKSRPCALAPAYLFSHHHFSLSWKSSPTLFRGLSYFPRNSNLPSTLLLLGPAHQTPPLSTCCFHQPQRPSSHPPWLLPSAHTDPAHRGVHTSSCQSPGSISCSLPT